MLDCPSLFIFLFFSSQVQSLLQALELAQDNKTRDHKKVNAICTCM